MLTTADFSPRGNLRFLIAATDPLAFGEVFSIAEPRSYPHERTGIVAGQAKNAYSKDQWNLIH